MGIYKKKKLNKTKHNPVQDKKTKKTKSLQTAHFCALFNKLFHISHMSPLMGELASAFFGQCFKPGLIWCDCQGDTLMHVLVG